MDGFKKWLNTLNGYQRLLFLAFCGWESFVVFFGYMVVFCEGAGLLGLGVTLLMAVGGPWACHFTWKIGVWVYRGFRDNKPKVE